MKLWGYFRSSAAFRARIALALKGIPYDQGFVHLRKAEQRSPEFLARNPQGLVPFLEDGSTGIAQSLAICEYLDEIHPAPPFLPTDPAGRARVRSLTLAIAAGATFLEAAHLANHDGGIVVMKRGTATVSATELKNAVAASGETKN